MKKKLLVCVVVISLVLTGLSAASKNNISVGLNMGYSLNPVNQKYTQSNQSISTKNLNKGFSIAGTAEFGLSKDVSLKANVGVDIFGKASITTDTKTSIGNTNNKSEASESTGANFVLFVAPQYSYRVNKNVKINGALGLDMMYGKYCSYTGNDENLKKRYTNLALGLGLEASGTFSVAKNVNLNLGTRFSWYFVNNAEGLKKNPSYGTYSLSNLAFRFFLGATYTL